MSLTIPYSCIENSISPQINLEPLDIGSNNIDVEDSII